MFEISIGRIPAITGSAGATNDLASHLAALSDSRKVALMADPALEAGGQLRRILAALEEAGFETLPIVLPPGEPKERLVDAAVAQVRTFAAGAMVCLGGGSAMDAGKVVANLAPAGEGVASYRLAAQPMPRERLPLICAPTTAGTGAEATAVSVLSSPEGVKYWFWANSLKPDLILHDPALAVGLPAAVTAATGVDALVHAIEAATNANATPTNNIFAYRAIELVATWLPVAVRTPSDLEARARMLEAATFAGVAIDNAGTAIAHNIGHALGSLAPVPHGRAVAIGMCATLAWNVEANAHVYEPVARAMGVAGGAGALPAAFNAFVRSLGVDLKVAGVAADQLARQMAEPENAAMLQSNRRPATPEDLIRHAAAAVALAD